MDTNKKFKIRRKELGLTMLDIAKMVGVSEATISRWESGDIANMRRDKIVRYAKALKVPPSFVMTDEETSFTTNSLEDNIKIDSLSHKTEIQKRLKEQRLKNGYTLAEVAELINVKEATVQRYESGEIKNLKHDTIVKLAEIFKCSPCYLMGWQTEVKETSTTNLSKYTDHHIKVIDAYIAKPEMQPAVDKLLGITSDNYVSSIHLSDTPYVAAQSGKEIKAGIPDLEDLIELEKSKQW